MAVRCRIVHLFRMFKVDKRRAKDGHKFSLCFEPLIESSLCHILNGNIQLFLATTNGCLGENVQLAQDREDGRHNFRFAWRGVFIVGSALTFIEVA
jgi:hypothetical protein